MKKLYAAVTGTTNILSITVTSSHSAQTAVAEVESIFSSLSIGDSISIDLGYVDNHAVVFTGFVKNIERKEPKKTYLITACDRLIRAADFFIVSSDPETPFSRQNISAESLISDLLGLAGITSGTSLSASFFTFAINGPVEINLISSYDYCRYISDLIAWNIYADKTGTIYFRDRKPFVITASYDDDKPYSVPADVPIGTITSTEIENITLLTHDKNLRNKVVIYGQGGIHAEASASSPYLPAGYYKSMVVSAPQIFDNVPMMQDAADYNLQLYNRLTQAAQVSILGDPIYEARKVLTVNYPDFGITNQNWYIFSAEHSWNSSGYRTTMELRI